MALLQSIETTFRELLASTYPTAVPPHTGYELAVNADEQRQAFGDLSSNAALIIAKQVGKPPRVVAEALIASFHHPYVERCEIAGPGFINIHLTRSAFQTITHELLRDGESWFSLPAIAPRHRHSIEFVSANPTGPLHIGHGRNGIIGDVLARVLRFLGHHVTTEFYINDAGAQIEKLGISLKIRCEQLLGNPDKAIPEEGYHGEYLVTLARELIAAHNSILAHPPAWFGAHAKESLLAALKATLTEYRIHFDVWFSELTLHSSGAIERALDQLKARSHLYEEEGALWLRATAFGDDKDRVVRRSNGEYTYLAADIAYLVNKLERGYEYITIVLGQDHHSYLTRLKVVMEALGHNPDQLRVILYQLVTLKNEGELLKLSKRAGRIVGLADIIEAAGADVARFFYLNRKADAHLEIDISLALKRTDENPVFYLHYAYVRTGSILEKAAACPEFQNIGADDATEFQPAEQLLLKKICTLQGLLRHIGATGQTHMLAYYSLELATLFHSYYTHHRIVVPQDRVTSRARLLLVQLVRQTLQLCFELLGISRPDRM